ncbi:uncharacterized protein Dwil_GK14117 [Drosophila willistoni]|uniref:SH2 domain-containing protein n=1 Tax=Drosophila willistoni TaxID=7260 RepID=B4NGS4_DROWI|nr:uncharacterized protein LOC6650146 [Drosophila willistoni]EDW84421.2 uncharacterized protein Dwil_GK14117 [Drosophila willistoni]
MCCWCARVYWTVVQNLFARFFSNLTERGCRHCGSCFCCSDYQRQTSDDVVEALDIESMKQVLDQVNDDANAEREQVAQHDYVIVDDADANYVEIEDRRIETEPYYFTVDRAMAEQMLEGREDGSCLVRPFKAADLCIKYIVSIYAANEFYHLFVRQLHGQRHLYGIGQVKPHERHFASPSHIVEFYAEHPLLCTNKQRSQCVRLKPIVYA